MTWSLYASYLVFVVLIAIAPGPDTMVVLKNALSGGARGGLYACSGIALGNFVQATAVGLGLGALIVRWQPVFETVRWAGVVYLCWLGFQALRGAWRGDYAALDALERRRATGFRRWREGFLSNITNPKVLAFYLSVLPQFLDPATTGAGDALLLAYTVLVVGTVWQLGLLLVVHRVNAWLRRRRVRRTMDAVTGTALIGFGIALAAD
ncbi:LysE family translocator [Amycolatopsis thermophila]|uniref:RhtB (Resistance to homoserine/threonine) family protein n=1 Tax=Amycolatopsis thermophila TaxID=206084 RepID=A0ABU0EQ88_9PSEU|nr:LysE family translocator [Amycolatopsis thermophila]MDQ0376957.1 RhtB (resistance to homoserine/threonine) family protein [Amycolatopsis thermophila]